LNLQQSEVKHKAVFYQINPSRYLSRYIFFGVFLGRISSD